MRHLLNRIDGICGRLNDGLIAVTIVLAILLVMIAGCRAVQALDIPKGFAIDATT